MTLFALSCLLLVLLGQPCLCWSPSLGPLLDTLRERRALGEAASSILLRNMDELVTAQSFQPEQELPRAPPTDPFVAFAFDLIGSGWNLSAVGDADLRQWPAFLKKNLPVCSYKWGPRVNCSQGLGVISLNLTRCELPSAIPPSINAIKGLTVLDLSWNHVRVMPTLELPVLEELYVGFNRLESFAFVTAAALPALRELGLSNNFFSSAADDEHPPALPPSLVWLDLSASRLNGVPRAVMDLPALTWLDLKANTNIREFPAGWPGEHLPKTLTTLGLSDTSLCEAELLRLGPLPQLEWLNLGFPSGFTELPEGLFAGLPALTRFNCYQCPISSVPRSLTANPRLKFLLLSLTKVTGFDDSLCDAVNLVELDVSQSRLRHLPACLGQLKNLTSLRVFENPGLRELPASFGGLSSLKVLYASESGLGDPPESICELLSLEELYWDDNGATHLPACIKTLPALRTLWLRMNQIVDPVPILNPNLVILIVAQNNMTGSTFGELDFCHPDHAMPRLQVFSLAHTHVRKLPASIGCLRSLVFLDAFGCQLQVPLPPSLADLTNLTRLDLHQNPDAGPLPDLDRLRRLQVLSIGYMGLSRLPALPASLVRLEANDNNLNGSLSLCGALNNLELLNLNFNPGVVVRSANSSTCLPKLKYALLERAGLKSVTWLLGAAQLGTVDLSDNPELGPEEIFTLIMLLGKHLTSLSISNTGLGHSINVVYILSLIKEYAPSLTDLDASRNNITGSISIDTLARYGLYKRASYFYDTFNLTSLDLSGTALTGWHPLYTARSFPRLQSLMLAGVASLPASSVPSDFAVLKTLDVRKSFGEGGAGNRTFGQFFWRQRPPDFVREAGTIVDLQGFQSCPELLESGEVSTFSVRVNPADYGSAHCVCLKGFFGSPGRCRKCPEVRVGSPVSVECTNGSLAIVGGWFVFNESVSALDGMRGTVTVKPCPADSQFNPCVRTYINVTMNTMSDYNRWFSAAYKNKASCTTGYYGRLCSRCRPKYYASGRGCFPCRGGTAWIMPVLSILVLTVLGVRVSLGTRIDERSGLIRTGINHLQVLGNLPSMNLRLSQLAALAFRKTSSAGGGLLFDGIECEIGGEKGWSPVIGPWVLAALLPVVAVVGAVWISAWSLAVDRGHARRGWGLMRKRSQRVLVYLWMVLLYGSVEALLVPANCTTYAADVGKSYLVSALWYRCWTPDHKRIFSGGLAFAFTYVGLSLWALWWALLKKRTAGPARPLQEALLGDENPAAPPQKPKMPLMAQYLRAPFNDESEWWEAVSFGRRLLLALIFTLSPFETAVGPVLVSLLLVVALAVQAWRKPFREPLDNVFETISLVILLSTYCSGLASAHATLPWTRTISWVLFAVNAIFVAVLMVLILWTKARAWPGGWPTWKRAAQSNQLLVVKG
jgi:Leucine-rich repeat (LRR) protein